MTLRRHLAVLALVAASAAVGQPHAWGQGVDPFVEAARVASRPVDSAYGDVQLTSGDDGASYPVTAYEAGGGYTPADYVQASPPYSSGDLVGPVGSWGYSAPSSGWSDRGRPPAGS